MSVNNNLVCYGDIVYIDIDDYMLALNGFFGSVAYGVHTKNYMLKSFRHGLFQLHPNYSYKDSGVVDDLENQLDLLNNMHQESEHAYQDMQRDLMRERITNKKRNKLLKKMNQKMFDESKGVPIRYGNKFQLFHLESETFVQESKKVYPNYKTMNQLELADRGSKMMYFTFLPSLNLRSIGECVEYDVHVKITSYRNNFPVSIGPILKPEQRPKEIDPATNSLMGNKILPQVYPRKQDPVQQAKNICFFGIESFSSQKNPLIRKYINYQDYLNFEKKGIIKNGDYIRITDGTVYLTAYNQRDDDNKAKIIFENYSEPLLEDYDIAHTVFEIVKIPDEEENYIDTYELPEAEKLYDDEDVRYLIRHVVSGLHLALDRTGTELVLKDIKNFDQMDYITISIQNGINADEVSTEITKDSIVQIILHSPTTGRKRVLTQGPRQESKEKMAIESNIASATIIKGPQVESKYFVGSDPPLNYIRPNLGVHSFDVDLLTTEEAEEQQNTYFQLQKISDKEMTSILTIESFANRLQRYLDFLDGFLNDENAKIKQLTKETAQLDKDCASFIKELFDKDEGPYVAGQEDSLYIDKLRQSTLKYFQVFDTIYIIILYLCRHDSILNKMNEIHHKLESDYQSIEKKLKPMIHKYKTSGLKNAGTIMKLNSALSLNMTASASFKKSPESSGFKRINVKQQDKGRGNDIEETKGQGHEEKDEGIIESQKDVNPADGDIGDSGGSDLPDLEISKLRSVKSSMEVDKMIQKYVDIQQQKSDEVDFKVIISLLSSLQTIIQVSFKQNDSNRYYCSQYTRLVINTIINVKKGPFSLSTFYENIQMKSILLSIAKLMLWDQDPESLKQLNFYKEKLYKGIEQQGSFHSIYLQLLEHISRSQCPNLFNDTRNDFIFKFIQDQENFVHVFPGIKQEGNRFMINFQRKTHHVEDRDLFLEDLNETLKIDEKRHHIKGNTDIAYMSHYFKNALKLVNSLVTKYSSTLDLIFVKYYPYSVLTAALESLKESSQHSEIRLEMAQMIANVHQNYFAITLTRLPRGIRVIHQDGSEDLDQKIKEIESFIDEASYQSIGDIELEFIKKKGCLDLVDQLKETLKQKAREEELLDRMAKTNNFPKDVQERSLVIEGIRKLLLGINNEVSFGFIEHCHSHLIDSIKLATDLGEREHYEFISRTLDVLSLVEKRFITFAAIEMTKQLSSAEYFENPGENLNDKTVHVKGVAMPGEGFKGVMDDVLRNYKNKLGVQGNTIDFNNQTVIRLQNQFKQYTFSIIQTLLHVFLLKDDVLSKQVIIHLRRIVGYEQILFSELQEFALVDNSKLLDQINNHIQLLFKINKITREVNFCKENGIEINIETMNYHLQVILDSVWELFFSIYNPSKHFSFMVFATTPQESQEQFKNIFYEQKSDRFDIPFTFKEKAINRKFQKVFNALGIHKPLLRVLSWVHQFKRELKNYKHFIVQYCNELVQNFFIKNELAKNIIKHLVRMVIILGTISKLSMMA